MPEAAVVINATSLGMVGKPELTIDLNPLSEKTLVTDLVYNPLKTQLLTRAAEKGCRTVDGIGMLIHQAVPGFARWFNVQPTVDITIRDILLS